MLLCNWSLFFLCSSTVAAHGAGPGIFGGLDALRALAPTPRFSSRVTPNFEFKDVFAREEDKFSGHFLSSRAEKGEKIKCGTANGSCPAGYCCSIGGWCGKDFNYCSGPACQLSFGDKCDGNIPPKGTTTKNVARPQIGNVTYGGRGIYTCTNKNHVALTFDDGPYIYTSEILDILAEYNAKATFFITGNNMGKGAIDNETTGYPQIIKRMHQEGHQIASHTWTHQNLSAVTQEQRENQIYYNEMAIRNILGFFPTYMRPPYSQANADVQTMLADMGYHITYYNMNSDDYNNNSPELIQNSKNEINKQFATVKVQAGYPANFIEIAHDIHEQTARNLTRWTLNRIKELGLGTSITVGECLNDPPENWYRTADGAPVDAALSRNLANVSPTAVPSTGPGSTSSSSSSSSSYARATDVGGDGRLGLMGIGVVVAGVLLG